jgi:hypothetical protein
MPNPIINPTGIFHTSGEVMRMQTWSGAINVASSTNYSIIRNRGTYGMCTVEIFMQHGYGPNGYAYFLGNVSAYGLFTVTNAGDRPGSFNRLSENGGQWNSLRYNTGAGGVGNIRIHARVYYHSTETGLEVDSPIGLTLVSSGV